MPKVDSIFTDLSLKDCYRKSSIEKACDCNKEKNENKTFIFNQPKFNESQDKIKLEIAKNSFQQAQKSLFQLAQDLTSIDTSTNQNNIGKYCSLNRLEESKKCNTQGSVFQLLNKNENNFLNNFQTKMKEELDSRRSPYLPSDIGMIERSKFKDDDTCNISDFEVLKAQTLKIKSQFIKMISEFNLLEENGSSSISDTILKNIEKLDNFKLRTKIQGFLASAERTPLTRTFLRRAYTENTSKQSIKNLLNSDDLQNELSYNMQKDCDIFYKNMEDFLCSSAEKLGTNEDLFLDNLKKDIPLDNQKNPLPKESPEYQMFQLETAQKLAYACKQPEKIINKNDEVINNAFNYNIQDDYKKMSLGRFTHVVYQETSVDPRTEICAEILKDEGLVAGKLINIYEGYTAPGVIQSKLSTPFKMPAKQHGANLAAFLGEPASQASKNIASEGKETKKKVSDEGDNVQRILSSSSSHKRLEQAQPTQISQNTGENTFQDQQSLRALANKKVSRSFTQRDPVAYENDLKAIDSIRNKIDSMKRKRDLASTEIERDQYDSKIDDLRKIKDQLSSEMKDLKNTSMGAKSGSNSRLSSNKKTSTSIAPTVAEMMPANNASVTSTNDDYNSQTPPQSETSATSRSYSPSKNILGEKFKDNTFGFNKTENNFKRGIQGEEVPIVEIAPEFQAFDIETFQEALSNPKLAGGLQKFMNIIKQEDAFILTQKDDTTQKVLIKKEGNSFRIINEGDLSDPKFKSFYTNIVKAFNSGLFSKLEKNQVAGI